MKRVGILAVLFLAIVIAIGSILLLAVLLSEAGSGGFGSDKVVVVRIDDMIIDPREYLERFEKYRDREDIKAVVLRMETPGGTVAGSQEIAQGVTRLRRDHGKIVVTSVSNVGASGGYYIASQCDAIIANPGSLVGSIGVILEHMAIHKMTDKLGVEFEAIKSGPLKDAGSALRPMSQEERAYLQAIVDDAYHQFRAAVREGRRESLADAAAVSVEDTAAIEAHLDRVADGRILTGAQAFDAGLVDRLGDLEEAIALARELSGLTEADVVYDDPKKPLFDIADFMGKAMGAVSPAHRLSYLAPGGLWYLYR